MKFKILCSLYDVLIFTLTWLSDNIMSTELGFHNYDIYRLDRTVQTSLLSRGGGVLIAVQNNLHCKLIKVENKNI